ncbi:MAG: acyl-CoA dehydrogenase family protein, partial [Bdellovibrionales bacterium]|nr:acyl-CoA dehydrogenase family protein [Bdellovibrionales bacterium]
ITVPEAYGGSAPSPSELTPLAVVIAHEELSAVDPGFCLAYLAHSLLCVNNIAVNGTEEQKARFLPKLCTGEWVGAMGMSEPQAGTDVMGLSTTARREGDLYILNGRKMWITNGSIDDNGTPCDCVYLYARTGVEPNGKPEVSSFIVTREDPGFQVGQKISGKLGMRASNTAELCFDDCRIPISQRIGEEGDAVLHMMRNLELERLGLAAMSLGIARRALEIMVKYSGERKAFGKQLHEFGQIQRYIGDSFAEYRAAKAYIHSVASSMNLHASGNRLDSDGVKLFAAPIGKRIADRAIQVLGGYGYVGEYTVERLWRDSKLLEIGGGTLEAHQKNIARDLSLRTSLEFD